MGAFEWFLVAVGMLLYPIYSNWILSKQLDYRLKRQDDEIKQVERTALHAHKRIDRHFKEDIYEVHYHNRDGQ